MARRTKSEVSSTRSSTPTRTSNTSKTKRPSRISSRNQASLILVRRQYANPLAGFFLTLQSYAADKSLPQAERLMASVVSGRELKTKWRSKM